MASATTTYYRRLVPKVNLITHMGTIDTHTWRGGTIHRYTHLEGARGKSVGRRSRIAESVQDLSDVPGDPGSQLPYQEFPPYYLAPI